LPVPWPWLVTQNGQSLSLAAQGGSRLLNYSWTILFLVPARNERLQRKIPYQWSFWTWTSSVKGASNPIPGPTRTTGWFLWKSAKVQLQEGYIDVTNVATSLR
jgi:hypothetical protein